MSSQHSPSRSSKAGFTLIEILIVVAIIGLLVAVLFPVFASARENGRRASCSSNLKQIGLALQQYTQDYDDTFPCFYAIAFEPGITHNTWKLLQPYSKSQQIFYCPSTTAYTDCYQDITCTETGKEISYGFNVGPVWQQNKGTTMGGLYSQVGIQSVGNQDLISIQGRHLAHIVSPSSMFMASDAYDVWVHSMDPTSSWQNHIPNNNLSWRHGNRRNILFADLHVKAIAWRSGKSTPPNYYWGETLMLPRDSDLYASYCANPDDEISFSDSASVRCADIPGLLADSVYEWQSD